VIIGFFGSLMGTLGCTMRQAEDATSWYDPGQSLDVTETVAFTDVNYAFPKADSDGIGQLKTDVFPVAGSYGKAFAEGQGFPAGDCVSFVDKTLPREIEGVVTIFPRFYFKTDGCTQSSEEKYYGSFFLQDRTGGVFVLGDTKLAHFEAGNRVRLKVRSVSTSFDLDMIYGYDVISVDHTITPIFHEPVTGTLGDADVGEVRRVEGVVTSEPDTFGSFTISTDAGDSVLCALDSEINDRGTVVALEKRLQVTGPVLFSYDEYEIVVMEKGQIQELQ
jgi:hypothetical protein